MDANTTQPGSAERKHVTRTVEVVLDPSPSQERWLRSYAGSMRAAYNWALGEVRDNLAIRANERGRGVAEDVLTPALSWSQASLTARWRPLEVWPDVPTRFVLCTEDRFFPPTFMRAVVADRLAITADEVAAGHCVALSRPDELVTLLLR